MQYMDEQKTMMPSTLQSQHQTDANSQGDVKNGRNSSTEGVSRLNNMIFQQLQTNEMLREMLQKQEEAQQAGRQGSSLSVPYLKNNASVNGGLSMASLASPGFSNAPSSLDGLTNTVPGLGNLSATSPHFASSLDANGALHDQILLERRMNLERYLPGKHDAKLAAQATALSLQLSGSHPTMHNNAYLHGFRDLSHEGTGITMPGSDALLNYNSKNSKETVPKKKHNYTVFWGKQFNLLMKYKEEHGNCLVPQTHPQLGSWVKKQREHYENLKSGKSSSLTPEKIDLLNQIGFVWRVRSKRGQGTVNRGRGIEKKAKQKSNSSVHDTKTSKGKSPADNTSNEKPGSTGGSLTSDTTLSLQTEPANNRKRAALLEKLQDGETASSNWQVQGNVKMNIESSLMCKICCGIIKKYTICHPCGHSYCNVCLDAYLKCSGNRCLTCGKEVTASTQVPSMDQLIKNMMKSGFFQDNDIANYVRNEKKESPVIEQQDKTSPIKTSL